ncbi:ribosome maturation factor RimP [Tellurirhabdus bombi]|uniref:ribosome maturation factor RimP n=1 Tax=Tellurirhabdus bombi TaxID=2907205 RepID=UPI001F44C8AE|nr:ribosome maturation factor RimP [Tellurirhabdus bombi]
MDVKAKVTELLQPYLNEDQFFIVDIQVSPSRSRSKITVLLDSDTGITIDECTEISRRLGSQLEELDLFDGAAFVWEVSSPGIGEPLTLLRQYRKNIGREVTVLLNDGQIRKGTLEDANDERILITETPVKKPKKKDPPASGPVEIPFTDIKKTTIQVSFK